MASALAELVVDAATSAVAGRNRLLSSASEAADALRRSANALAVLDITDAIQLPPTTLERCGKLAESLQASGFDSAKVKHVLRALFCNHLVSPSEAEQQMERAFDVWDEGHRGVLEISAISHDLSALLAGDLELHERQQLIEGLGADGSGQLEYEGFREVMKALGAEPRERKARLAALRLYSEDVGLARTALGSATSFSLSRHELRVAGAVVRVLQREMYRAEDAAALLPALGLPSPSEAQLRAAFKVFDVAGRGEALDAEYVREQLQILMPHAAALVWGTGSTSATGLPRSAPSSVPSDGSGSFLGGGASSFIAGASSFLAGGSSFGAGASHEMLELLTFDDFVATLAQLRQALASHALAAGVHTEAVVQKGWLTNLVASVSHSARALASLKPRESLLLSPARLAHVGRLLTELSEEHGMAHEGCLALVRSLFLPHDPDATKEVLLHLDLKRTGVVPMARVRRLLPTLSRHLPPSDAEARIASALSDVSDVHGLELADLMQLLASLRPPDAVGEQGGVLGDSLAGLASIEADTASRLPPLQLQRVGRIARRMQADGYPPQAINTVVRVLFVSTSRADLERAFTLLDKERTGSLHAGQFRQLLYVAGEYLPEQDELDEWFEALDVDASGRLEMAEFAKLVRALRRAIAAGHKTTLGTLTSTFSDTAASVAASALEPTLMARLTPLERRRAGRVADALQRAEFSMQDTRRIVRALFDNATEAELRAAFAVFDKDGEGSLDAEEFREMLPVLAGDLSLPFARIEALFREADKDNSGVLEYTEFVWLIANLNASSSTANQSFVGGGGKSFKAGRSFGGKSFTKGAQSFTSSQSFTGGGGGHRYIKSVEELRADRLREAQQSALAERAARLRSKADILARACGLLHQERPLVCAELLMRLHRLELEEAACVRRAHRDVPEKSSDGLLLRGTPALLERRAEVVFRGLASLAVDERDRALGELRQAIRSIDEELPVTETASHGIARSRGLHARADRLRLVVELLSAPGGLAQASELLKELTDALRAEQEAITAAPAAVARGSTNALRALKQRMGKFSQLQLMLEHEQVQAAKAHAEGLVSKLRADAAQVIEFATQGVYVPPSSASSVSLPSIEGAESVMTAARYAQRWRRCRALLVAAEKVAQVLELLNHGKRRSLQEGVQLLVTMEETDIGPLFAIAREVMRLTDAELSQQPPSSTAPRATLEASRTVIYWHQIEDENDMAYEVKDSAEWTATKDLRRARLQLMNNRVAEGVAALEKLRQDLLLYARDAG